MDIVTFLQTLIATKSRFKKKMLVQKTCLWRELIYVGFHSCHVFNPQEMDKFTCSRLSTTHFIYSFLTVLSPRKPSSFYHTLRPRSYSRYLRISETYIFTRQLSIAFLSPLDKIILLAEVSLHRKPSKNSVWERK